MTYLAGKNIEVARSLFWASIQQERIDFGQGGGFHLPHFRKAVGYDRHSYDVLKVCTDGQAYNIVRRVEPFVDYTLEDVQVVPDPDISLGFEVWRQLHLEYFRKLKESGTNHMGSSFSLNPVRIYDDSRNTICEVEEISEKLVHLKAGKQPTKSRK